MSRHRAPAHPTSPGLIAHYGWDPALGFFVEVKVDGDSRILDEYDATVTADGETAPMGVLEVLARNGWFEPDDITDAGLRLGEGFEPDEIDEIDEPGARLCAAIITTLREDAGR